MESRTTRRALLLAAPAAAVMAVPALAATTAQNPDAKIIEAWERRQKTYADFHAMPTSGDPETIETENACWAIIDAAEEVIRSATAKTPRGAEIQIWVSLYHTTAADQANDDAAITRGDLDYLEARGPNLDWNVRMAVAALRSLKSMEA